MVTQLLILIRVHPRNPRFSTGTSQTVTETNRGWPSNVAATHQGRLRQEATAKGRRFRLRNALNNASCGGAARTRRPCLGHPAGNGYFLFAVVSAGTISIDAIAPFFFKSLTYSNFASSGIFSNPFTVTLGGEL